MRVLFHVSGQKMREKYLSLSMLGSRRKSDWIWEKINLKVRSLEHRQCNCVVLPPTINVVR